MAKDQKEEQKNTERREGEKEGSTRINGHDWIARKVN